ncbi:MAG: Peptidyl-alpha-hydroxyglycine alpha-amidating lyase [Chthonomonadaceae bacterium]|nr:Peptidyl-alpha-hydroxyglycine alpha-amidating lyase [Chthonomonadaceae bacterium]
MSCLRSRFMAMITLSVIALFVTNPLRGLSQGAVTFSYVPNHFPAQPDNQQIGPVHGGVAIDRAGNVYVSTDTPRGILVFGKDGKYLRNFGPTQVHGLYLTRERDGEYLYAARPNFHEVQKIKIDGTPVWTMGYPTESGVYTKAEEFNPTNIVVAPDGTIFVADGYGKNYVHKYDKDRKYIKSFGGPGGNPAEEGKFNRCHGITVDTRGPKPMLIICNRESGRVELWDMDGNFVKVLQRDLRMPAVVYLSGDYVAIGELQGRVTVLGKDNSIVAQLGDNPNASQRANYGLPPAQWTDGIVNSPHGIAIDKAGDIIVSEWSQYGRVEMFARNRVVTKR